MRILAVVTEMELPQEDRDAIAWVREHGGLDAVNRRWECLSYYADPVPRSYADKRIASRQRQIDESHAALRRRNARIAELERERDGLRTRVENQRSSLDGLVAVIDEMRPRLMPEGMEWLIEAWPRFEDDSPVKFRDEGLDVHGHTRSVEGIKFTQGGFVFISDDMGNTWWANDRGPMESPEIDPGKRVKRPAPKALDADGAEIRVKETVFDKNTGEELIVTGFEDGRVWCEHRMTDADALPVRGMWSPGLLTHERPDSWKRLEEDADATAHLFDAFDEDASARIRDIVRRAKALAGGA